MLRSAILRGPAVITFGAATFYSKDDITCNVDTETFEIMTSAYGVVDDREKERKAEVSFTPVGEWEATGIAELWTPFATKANGSSMFGTNKPLTITTLADGKTIVFAAAAVTKLPDLILSATKTMIGSVTFSCIGKDNTDWSAADSFMTVTAGAGPVSTSVLDPAIIWTAPWKAVYGPSPFADIQTIDGWVINFNLVATPFEVDSVGIMDYTFDRLDVIAKARLVGNTESDLITAMGIQGTGAVRGRSARQIAGTKDLVFSSTGAAQGLTLFKPAIIKSQMVFGAVANRIGETEFKATRALSGGAMQPLFLFAFT